MSSRSTRYVVITTYWTVKLKGPGRAERGGTRGTGHDQVSTRAQESQQNVCERGYSSQGEKVHPSSVIWV